MADSSLQPAAIAKVLRELHELQQQPIDGVKVFVNEDNIADIQAEYEGPPSTPYEDGLFRMRLVLGADFPRLPPKGYFLTKLFHPNVSPTGEICVNVLKRDWAPTLGLRHILTVIRCLLIEPNAESALNEEAGKLLLESFDDFRKRARLMTEVHARKPQVLTAAGGANALNSDAVHAADGRGQASAKPKVLAGRAGVDKKRSLKRL